MKIGWVVIASLALLAGCTDIPPKEIDEDGHVIDPQIVASTLPTLGRIAVAPIESVTLSEAEAAPKSDAEGDKWTAEEVFVRGQGLDLDVMVAHGLDLTKSYEGAVKIGDADPADAWKDQVNWVLSVKVDNVHIVADTNGWYWPNALLNFNVWVFPGWFVATHEYTLALDAHVTVASGESGALILEDKVVPVEAKGTFDELDRGLHLVGPYAGDDGQGCRLIATRLLPEARRKLAEVVAATLEKELRPAIQEKPLIHQKTLLLTVGITRYADSARLPRERVRYASEDADELAGVLEPWGADSRRGHVASLTDDHATLANLREAITAHLGRAREGDNVILYFAGCGTRTENGEPVLLFHESAKTGEGQLTLRELGELLAPIHGTKLVLLDTAFDGLGRPIKGGAAPAGDPADLAPFNKPDTCAFAAASRGQTAIALTYLNHGLFTYHVLRALHGEADEKHEGLITMDRLVRFVRKPVVSEASYASEKQTPTSTGTTTFTLKGRAAR